ncbi:single-stranded-DNA-specific exonuclease RecJ [Clostridium magnum]|uniref:Single-stranded-DNA-specific exonuclease RecJ n=1 Tax=Clostridium magnum DSM 2767 TaxID=1121326 RepID=A0A161YSK1_9CLOT|nr:single-stranded-DNA-specific exonuclease RecJ [Clostridium magnum]KZL94032.1 single-stranded-DNA-specific exonuclease RecJ [Clostridium magnum DSM 2767]SHI00719.1 exonuclease RecJ [Clostridium magnum DSM 2767]
MARWMLKRCSADIKDLSRKTSISEIIISILVNRGIKTEEEIIKFMNPKLENLHNPMIMKDMDKGTAIIKNAIEEGKKIVVYGDYDCDGIISTYILYSALTRAGADVKYHIPDRITEGYGINSDSIKVLKEEGYEVIITCDNGIAAIEQIKFAKELGMTVVITDHHDIPFVTLENGERQFVVPEADAVINPKQYDCSYPFKMLCGAGVAFKFVQVLYKNFNIPKEEAYEFMEYAAIGTICDVVDLTGENRIIAKIGLGMLNSTANIGIKALIKETSLEGKKLNSYHIGFVIGPCINATGRLESAILALRLLLSIEEEEAQELAKKLHNLNSERQDMTVDSVNKIIEMIECSEMRKDKVLVVYKPDVHESIAGIVAGRLKERYNVPAIVLTQGEKMPKGSGRSIEEYNMFEELIKCKELMEKFGGHPLAAGLSIKEENIDFLRKALNSSCSLKEEDIIPKIRIDRQLHLNEISFKLIEDIEKLEPFGKANSSPIFAEKNVTIFRVYLIGKDKNILKLFCRPNGSFEKLDAICFDGGEKFKEMISETYGEEKLLQMLNNGPMDLKMDLIFSPSINEYNGNISLQLVVKDFRLSNV